MSDTLKAKLLALEHHLTCSLVSQQSRFEQVQMAREALALLSEAEAPQPAECLLRNFMDDGGDIPHCVTHDTMPEWVECTGWRCVDSGQIIHKQAPPVAAAPSHSEASHGPQPASLGVRTSKAPPLGGKVRGRHWCAECDTALKFYPSCPKCDAAPAPPQTCATCRHFGGDSECFHPDLLHRGIESFTPPQPFVCSLHSHHGTPAAGDAGETR